MHITAPTPLYISFFFCAENTVFCKLPAEVLRADCGCRDLQESTALPTVSAFPACHGASTPCTRGSRIVHTPVCQPGPHVLKGQLNKMTEANFTNWCPAMSALERCQKGEVRERIFTTLVRHADLLLRHSLTLDFVSSVL